MDTTRRVEVGCRSGRAGTGPATWGQHAVWDAVRQLGADAARYNVSLGMAVPPGVPVSLVLESLGQLLPLHDALRTRLLLNDQGQLQQVVDSSGVVPVLIRRARDDEVRAQGGEMLRELTRQSFDCAREWPIRVGIVESAGLVRHIAFSLSHTAADAWGLQCLVVNLTDIAGGEAPDQVGVRRPALQPLEEAAFQRSEYGLRQDAAARGHWREKLTLGPPRLFPGEPGTADGPLFPNAVLNSPALRRAVERVAAARRVSSSSVLLAAASVMLCRLSGSPDATLQIVVDNRFLPNLTHSVSTVAQEGLFHLPDVLGGCAGSVFSGDPADVFPEVIRRTHAASHAVQRNAYYNKALLDEDIAKLAAQDGAVADVSCIFNDTRGLIPQTEERSLYPAPLERERSRTTLSWPAEFEPRRNVTFELDIVDVPGSIELSMTADSAVLPRPDMARLLYGIEDLVVRDALGLECD